MMMKAASLVWPGAVEKSELSLPPTVNIANPIYKGCVPMHTTSKRIELKSPGCTGFEENSKCFKT